MSVQLTDINHDAVLAKVIALAARNGVEDLHARGAFSDSQAPSLNRRLRGRVYEVLTATRHLDSRYGKPFVGYMHDVARGHKGGLATAALHGAIARAVDDFAVAEAIDSGTARKLRDAAVEAALVASMTVDRVSHGISPNQEDRQDVEYWLRSIPPYWEEPTVSPKFQRLLDTSAHDRPGS